MKRGNPEAHVVLQIVHYCKMKGWNIGKIKNKGSQIGKRFIFDPYQWRGLPDLLLFTETKMIFIEAKSKDGHQSQEQLLFQALCKRTNTPYILAHSLDEFISKIV